MLDGMLNTFPFYGVNRAQSRMEASGKLRTSALEPQRDLKWGARVGWLGGGPWMRGWKGREGWERVRAKTREGGWKAWAGAVGVRARDWWRGLGRSLAKKRGNCSKYDIIIQIIWERKVW